MTYCLQDLFIAIFRPFLKMTSKIDEKCKSYLRIAGFVALFMLTIITRVNNSINYRLYGPYVLLCCVIMFGIAILSLEDEVKRVKWNKPFVAILAVLFALMLISEVLVFKTQFLMEVVLVLFFGGILYTWQNSGRKDQFFNEFMTAAKIVFWLLAVICFMFRPRIAGDRYYGFFKNPNCFAYHLLAFIAIFIASIDDKIQKKEKLYRALGDFFGIGLSVFYLDITQSRTSLAAIGTMTGIWFLARLIVSIKNKNFVTFMKFIIVMVLVMGITYPVADKALDVIPKAVGHPIKWGNYQSYKVREFEATVPKGPSKGPALSPAQKMIKKLQKMFMTDEGLNKLLSGRLTLYRSYLSDLNYKGHQNVTRTIEKVVWTSAHSNFIQVMYLYGKLTIIPYVLMILGSIYYGFRYFKRNYKSCCYAALPMIFMIGYAVNTTVESFYQPLHRFPAFVFWFLVMELAFTHFEKKKKEA